MKRKRLHGLRKLERDREIAQLLEKGYDPKDLAKPYHLTRGVILKIGRTADTGYEYDPYGAHICHCGSAK